MGRSHFTATLTAALLLAVARSVAAPAEGTTDPKLLEKAKEVHRRIMAFDSHLDLPFDYPGASTDGKTQFDLPKVKRGQLKGAALAVFVPQGPRTPQGYAQAQADAEKKYNLIKAVAEQNPSLAAQAYSPADVRRIAEQGKFAVVVSLLNAYPLGTDLSQIDEWYRRGVRIFGYTHAGHNQWADSSRPNQALGDAQQEHGGLSDLGKQGIARLNELGMLIDVSQLTTSSLKQVLSLTKAPVAATHSGVKGLVDSPRNLTDEELELIKKNGGVVQVVAFGNYVRAVPKEITDQIATLQAEYGYKGNEPPPGLSEAKRAEYAERNRKILSTVPAATVAQFVDSIDYAVRKIGIDHVGISSDFNHGGGVVGWENEGECQNVTAELLRRHYSEKDIAKLWGGNFLRVWSEAQNVGKALQAQHQTHAQ
jgi:microsomal dipeptidase-like Zn-dependent dipeptidase